MSIRSYSKNTKPNQYSCERCWADYSHHTGHRPLLLPCGHDFCAPCAELLHNEDTKNIQCPHCRITHKVAVSDLIMVHRLVPDFKFKPEVLELQAQIQPVLSAAKQQVSRYETIGNQILASLDEVSLINAGAMNEIDKLVKALVTLTCQFTGVIKDNEKRVEKEVHKTTAKQSLLLRLVLEIKAAISEQNVDLAREKKKNLEDLVKEKTNSLSLSTLVSDLGYLRVKCAELLKLFKKQEVKIGSLIGDMSETYSDVAQLDAYPWDAAVCYGTAGFSLHNKVVVNDSKGEPLPTPAVFVVADKGTVLVIDEFGSVKGEVKLTGVGQPNLSCVCTWEDEKKLVLSDDKKHVVYLTSLHGTVISKSKPKLLVKPKGLCIIGDKSKLAVCDYGAAKVLILSLPDLQLVHVLSHPTLTHPYSVTSSQNYLYVANHSPSPSLITKFSIASYSPTTPILHLNLDYPLKVVYHSECLFVSSNHKVTQYSITGEELRETKQGEVTTPDGFCVFSSRSGAPKLMVCDISNARLKTFSFNQ